MFQYCSSFTNPNMSFLNLFLLCYHTWRNSDSSFNLNFLFHFDSDSDSSSTHSLRALFGTDKIQNAVHGCSTKEKAEKLIKEFFADPDTQGQQLSLLLSLYWVLLGLDYASNNISLQVLRTTKALYHIINLLYPTKVPYLKYWYTQTL